MNFQLSESLVLDGYRLIRFLGRGGFGEVWLCRSESMGDYRALKIIPSTSASLLKKEHEALLQYRKAASALRSPHLLSIEHVNLIEGGLFYVMPLADGSGADDPANAAWLPLTLGQKIHDQKESAQWFSSSEIIAMILPVLDALQTLSDAGLVHRDVKPDNILFFDGKPCLGDVSLLGQDAEMITTRGTPGYATPSWYVDGQPDMYGVAATLYHLLTGNLPDKMGRSSFLWPPQGEASLTAKERTEWLRIHKVIRRACEEKPTERFLDFSAMARQLDSEIGQFKRNGKHSLLPADVKAKIYIWVKAAISIVLVALAITYFLSLDNESGDKPEIAARAVDHDKTLEQAILTPETDISRPAKIVDMRGHFKSLRVKLIEILPNALEFSDYEDEIIRYNLDDVSEVVEFRVAYESRDYNECLKLLDRLVSDKPQLGEKRIILMVRALVLKNLKRSEDFEILISKIENIPFIPSREELETEIIFIESLERFSYAEKLFSTAITASSAETATLDKIALYNARARFRILAGDFAGALADEFSALDLQVKPSVHSPIADQESYQMHLNTIVMMWELLEQEFSDYDGYLEANDSPEPKPDHNEYQAKD